MFGLYGFSQAPFDGLGRQNYDSSVAEGGTGTNVLGVLSSFGVAQVEGATGTDALVVLRHAIVTPTGVQLLVTIGDENLWIEIPNSQVPGWSAISNGNNPGWTPIMS
jgi:hypothetical protein